MMENVQKIKIKLENIWIDLIRGIYAPYMFHMCQTEDLVLVNRHASVTKMEESDVH